MSGACAYVSQYAHTPRLSEPLRAPCTPLRIDRALGARGRVIRGRRRVIEWSVVSSPETAQTGWM